MTDIGIIDVHSHMLFPCYLKGLKEMGIDPVKEDGFPTPEWSVEAHLEFMENIGIETSILSLSTPHIHHGDGELAVRLARRINEESAALCRQYPDKFKYAAVLPLPEVEDSIEEIRYNYNEPGCVAVKVASNNFGVYLGDSKLDPVFEELNNKKAVVMIHPSRAQAVPAHVFTEKPAPLFEYIVDTTRTVIDMITAGTLEKYPDIKIIVPHCGSYLPFVMHRLIGISKILIPNGLMSDVDVAGNVAKLYFDVAGDAFPVALPALLQIADPSHILFGGDYPYTPEPFVKNNREKFENYEPIRPYLEDIFRNNAIKLFSQNAR